MGNTALKKARANTAEVVEVGIGLDHLQKLASVKKPIIAIEELVWNALDADATEVSVEVKSNKLGGVELIQIIDNGTGFSIERCKETFGLVGDSPKKRAHRSPGGRVLHGREGQGRLKAFGIAAHVRWTSTYREENQLQTIQVEIDDKSLKKCEVRKLDTSPRSTGVQVELTGLVADLASLSAVDFPIQELGRRLALYLRQYPVISLQYNKRLIDPSTYELARATLPISVTSSSNRNLTGTLDVIEWKFPAERSLCLCDDDGFTRAEVQVGIHAKGFEFTAYLKSSEFNGIEVGAVSDIAEMLPDARSLIEAARDELRSYFRKRESKNAEEIVDTWKKEGIYPFSEAIPSPVVRVEQEVFNACAVKVHEYLPDFKKSDKQSKRLTLQLLRQSIESNPQSVKKILSEVLALPPDKQDSLASLLDEVSLSAIINATRLVTDRLKFLAGLDDVLFGELSETFTEKQQLHPLLSRNLWIFGEQYSLGIDEGSLGRLLEQHISVFGRSQLIDSVVLDSEGRQRRVDLMLYTRIPESRENRFEHLVVELKRPNCTLSQKELTQIENYALTVGRDPRFDKHCTRWTFMLIGASLDADAEAKAAQAGREPGEIYRSRDGDVTVLVKPWSMILAAAKWRYEFYREQLELKMSTDEGLLHLQERYPDLMKPQS